MDFLLVFNAFGLCMSGFSLTEWLLQACGSHFLELWKQNLSFEASQAELATQSLDTNVSKERSPGELPAP